MVGWHHQLNGYEFKWALGVNDGQGSLAFYSPWSYKELDMAEWLNWLTSSLTSVPTRNQPLRGTLNHYVNIRLVYWVLFRTVLSFCKYLHNELLDEITIVLKMDILNVLTCRFHISKLVWLPLLLNIVQSATEIRWYLITVLPLRRGRLSPGKLVTSYFFHLPGNRNSLLP